MIVVGRPVLLEIAMELVLCIFVLFVLFVLPVLVAIGVLWAIIRVGRGTLALIRNIVKNPDGKENAPWPRLDRDQIALTKYMRQAEARGMSHDELGLRLQRQGFSDEIIQKARQRLNS